jgi:magnesium-transporting ATPase (P-type)
MFIIRYTEAKMMQSIDEDKYTCTQQQIPLSWSQARQRLRNLLEDYMDHPRPAPTASSSATSSSLPINSSNSRKSRMLQSLSKCLAIWFQYDLDVYAGSFLVSLAFLIGSSLFLANAQRTEEYDERLRRFYKSQVAAAVIMMTGCLCSALLMRRRRDASAKDSGAAKRRAIVRYLSSLTGSKREEERDEKEGLVGSNSKMAHERRSHITPPPPHLAGTSLSDIYPVYRTTTTTGSSSRGKWVNIPALLLVEGDYVALQIGDIVPSKCCSAVAHTQSNNTNGRVTGSVNDTSTTTTPPPPRIVTLTKGQRIKTLATLGPPPKLPLGRTTIPSHSSTLLSLNNVMQIFVIQEAPMAAFLQRKRMTKSTAPQVHRQLHDIRQVMYVLSLLTMIVSYMLIAARPTTGKQDSWSVLFHAPLLAAMGGLPIISPIFLLLLEVVGTARILVAVHPFATTGSSATKANANAAAESQSISFHYSRHRSTNDASSRVLLRRYMWATLVSRVSLPLAFFGEKITRGDDDKSTEGGGADSTTSPRSPANAPLIPIPAASMCLLEKLGVATAFSLVDDELACETNSTPQQLLIPSANGLKLLDLCPTYDDDDDDDENNAYDDESDEDAGDGKRSTRNNVYVASSESEDSDNIDPNGQGTNNIRKFKRLRRHVRRRIASGASNRNNNEATGGCGGGSNHNATNERTPNTNVVDDDPNHTNKDKEDEVQFEDPLWWQHLPALKCIGLACLLVDQEGPPSKRHPIRKSTSMGSTSSNTTQTVASASATSTIEEKLVQHICVDEHRKQFQMLGSCIGFKTGPNSFGSKGDISPFDEVARFQVVSSRIFRNRLTTDTHALGLEDSRNWGKLRTDSTSVIVRDNRSKAYQLLTVGDPRVVTALCQEAWQGENSTILPLSSTDRQSILATSNDWTLADLDVAAFSYTPLPQTLAASFDNAHRIGTKRYLLDNPSKEAARDTISEEWSMIGNQIFLGVLGSSIIPRKEIEKLLAIFGEAGVRFVYFSPRNMRRTKEVASQMGIDVAWNCAISLRPLDAGEDDQYRMVSNYADWDVNAKLPHGIDDVRKHLEEVDNVPLLVSLFTDVTKESTAQMVETFQEYSDTVLAMGLSHLARNADIFDTADLSVGVDVLFDSNDQNVTSDLEARLEENVHPEEVDLVTSISTSSCLFRLKGPSSTAYMPEIIASSRAALEAAGSTVSFVTSACAAFSMYIVFAMCSVSTALPIIPALGSVLYLLFMLPITGLAMAMSEDDPESMKQVPPKNDKSLIFGKNVRLRVYLGGLLKGLLPAIIPQLLWLIAFGELMIAFEPDFVRERCGGANTWMSLVRCDDLKGYTGGARSSAGALTLASLALCTLISSASFLHRTKTIREEAPWSKNEVWLPALFLNLVILAGFLAVALDRGSFGALPWYFHVIAVLAPFLCLFVDEWLKIRNKKHVKRAVMMRRLVRSFFQSCSIVCSFLKSNPFSLSLEICCSNSKLAWECGLRSDHTGGG